MDVKIYGLLEKIFSEFWFGWIVLLEPEKPQNLGFFFGNQMKIYKVIFSIYTNPMHDKR